MRPCFAAMGDKGYAGFALFFFSFSFSTSSFPFPGGKGHRRLGGPDKKKKEKSKAKPRRGAPPAEVSFFALVSADGVPHARPPQDPRSSSLELCALHRPGRIGCGGWNWGYADRLEHGTKEVFFFFYELFFVLLIAFGHEDHQPSWSLVSII